MAKNKEITLKCEVCEGSIEKCDFCNEEFTEGKGILCVEYKHYCDRYCLADSLAAFSEAVKE